MKSNLRTAVFGGEMVIEILSCSKNRYFLAGLILFVC